MLIILIHDNIMYNYVSCVLNVLIGISLHAHQTLCRSMLCTNYIGKSISSSFCLCTLNNANKLLEEVDGTGFKILCNIKRFYLPFTFTGIYIVTFNVRAATIFQDAQCNMASLINDIFIENTITISLQCY